MIIYTLSKEDFDKTNKAMCLALGIDYEYISVEDQEFEVSNIGRGGKTKGTTGYKYTEEQKKNIRNSLKGKSYPKPPHTEESKRKISKAKKGMKLSDETKMKMSITRKNKKYKHSEETKQKLRIKALLREEKKRQLLGN